MAMSHTAVEGASCTPALTPELKPGPKPECGQTLTELEGEFAGVVDNPARVATAAISEAEESEYAHILRETGGTLRAVTRPDGTWRCPSATRRGVVYHIVPTTAGWQCECEGAVFRSLCWHVRSVNDQTTAGWAGAWVATNLNRATAPDGIRDTGRLLTLSISELRDVWQFVEGGSHPEWAAFVWDTLSQMLEAEIGADEVMLAA